MSSAVQSLIVFGHVYFLNPASNAPAPIGTELVNSTLIPNIDRRLAETGPSHHSRRTDYKYTPGIGTYKMHTQAATWNVARKTCKEEGGHLAIINSVAESEHLAQLGRNSKPHAGSVYPDYVHIGFHDLYQKNEYVTVHDESLVSAGFNVWNSGEPSPGDEHCGSINTDNGKLNNVGCTEPCGFICELPPA